MWGLPFKKMVKSAAEIELIKESSLLVSKTLAELANHIKPGVTPLFLDKLAEEFIRDHGAVPASASWTRRAG